jgi:hypothetical protein
MANPGKKFVRPHLNQWLGKVVHACHPSLLGSINRKITVQASLGINAKPYLKNNQIKKGWEHGLSGKGSALQVGDLKSKPQCCQKKKACIQCLLCTC